MASYRDLTLPPGTVLVGELGLGGQLRPVGQLEQRLQEAARLGFNRAVVPKGSAWDGWRPGWTCSSTKRGALPKPWWPPWG